MKVEARVLILRVCEVFCLAIALVASVAFERIAFASVPFERVALRFHMKCLRGLSCVCELRLRVLRLRVLRLRVLRLRVLHLRVFRLRVLRLRVLRLRVLR